jgi:aryl-alcohol dehydrogenase-like predicted oxidoreductase
MTYTRLGKSNLAVSRICLGTMHFGTRADEAESRRIMDVALEAGINFFDTADVYGGPGKFGLSEEIIGRWLSQGGERRDRVVLASKVYGADRGATPRPNEGPGISAFKVRKNAEGSLRRLQTDRIDLYQVHHIDRTVTEEEFWGTFERLQDRGDITYLGTSNFPGWGLARFQQAAARRGRLGIVSEQHMYNLFCRYPELEVLPAAAALGIGVLSYMPLAGGLLTGNRAPQAGTRTADVSREYGIDLKQNARLDSFASICKETGEEERNVAIAWVLSRTAVASAIVGVRSVEQIKGVLRAAELALDAAVVSKLDALFDINQGRGLRDGKPAPEAYAW